MRIHCIVKPRSKKNEVTLRESGEYEVRVTKSPHDGKANEAVIAALSSYFECPKSCVEIITGLAARKKIIRITK